MVLYPVSGGEPIEKTMGCNGCSLSDPVFQQDGSSYIDENVLDSTNKLNAYDWLKDVPGNTGGEIVEVRFKNTRKEFFYNINKLELRRGEMVAVGARQGHDIGIVSLSGYLAEKQFARKTKQKDKYKLHEIYRKATRKDVESWKKAKQRGYPVLLKSREIAEGLGLEMKISDIEFQGDGRKAIFYYIAEKRVDFRELIKLYASEFKIRIEMKQIGKRQEAGMVGGIGSCGRELCCSTWRTDLSSVSVDAARKQNLSPHAEKLTGQCGKLKCCLMYELDTYLESWNEFPRELLELETEKGIAYPQNVNVLAKTVNYCFKKEMPGDVFTLSTKHIKKAIDLNKRGKKVNIEKLTGTGQKVI